MPKNVTVYRVFIGSPGGLEAERRRFRDVLDKFNRVVARRHDVEFEPVGWEDTLPGVGRPQAQINTDLELCDYAVFAFHDRWGSRTGNGDLVGTEEEWQIAQGLYSAEGGYQIRQIALYFKDVPAAQLKDPGEELRKVQDFKEKVFGEKQHLCGTFDAAEAFADRIEHHLSDWLAKHVKPAAEATFADVSEASKETATPEAATFKPDFNFWFGEFRAETSRDAPNPALALTYLDKALLISGTDEQQASALFNKSVALGLLDRNAEEIAVYDELVGRFGSSPVAALQELTAKALFNKGVALGELDRSAEAIATYDDLIARFGTSDAATLQERVANSLFNKGFTLGTLDHSAEEIAIFDELIARFGSSEAAALQKSVAEALSAKGFRLGALDRSTEAIAVFDELVARFGTSDAATLQERVANALFNKGVTLGELGRQAEEIAVYDDLVARFGSSAAAALQEQVAMALVNKGGALGTLDRSAEEIATYNDLIARFSGSAAAALQDAVAKALVNKGATLGALGRSAEAIAVYDDLIERFGGSETPALQDAVARALFNKSCAFAQLGRISDCIGALDQWAEKRGGFDCEKVAYDSDFDGIRQRPKFVRYLKSKGCVI